MRVGGGFADLAVSPSLVLVSEEKDTFFLSVESSDPFSFGRGGKDGSSESLKRRFFLGGSVDVEPLVLILLVPFVPSATGGEGASSLAYFSFKPSFFHAGTCGLVPGAILPGADDSL